MSVTSLKNNLGHYPNFWTTKWRLRQYPKFSHVFFMASRTSSCLIDNLFLGYNEKYKYNDYVLSREKEFSEEDTNEGDQIEQLWEAESRKRSQFPTIQNQVLNLPTFDGMIVQAYSQVYLERTKRKLQLRLHFIFLNKHLVNILLQYHLSDIIMGFYSNFPTFPPNLPIILDARMPQKSGLCTWQ